MEKANQQKVIQSALRLVAKIMKKRINEKTQQSTNVSKEILVLGS